ncbi:MAG: PocR ligand-binding domain-containing protein [Oscillospiraceae bacterium]
MNVLFDNERLRQLINNLYILTGIHVDIMGAEGDEIRLSEGSPTFCRLINASPGGHARCETCDVEAAERCEARGRACSYRCHAGICETIVPISSGGVPVAYMMFGHLLDDSPLERQWENTLKSLSWYQWEMDELRAAFFELRQYSAEEIRAFTELLEALAGYIHQEGMIQATEHTDLYRLEMFLSQHYTENLTLAGISAELKIGRTKLCALAKKLSGGKTLTRFVTEKRIAAAKILLLQSSAPVSAVAEAVGISDYNYFTKVFKAATGLTPSAFRRLERERA